MGVGMGRGWAGASAHRWESGRAQGWAQAWLTPSRWQAEGEAPLPRPFSPTAHLAPLCQGRLRGCARGWPQGLPGAGWGAGPGAGRGAAGGLEACALEKQTCEFEIQRKFEGNKHVLGGPGQNFKTDQNLLYELKGQRDLAFFLLTEQTFLKKGLFVKGKKKSSFNINSPVSSIFILDM